MLEFIITQLAYPETAYYYYHWFVEHSDEIWLYFLKEFPGIAIQDMVCWAKEHAKNLSKQEFAPLAPHLHNGHLKKTFYRIMRNWIPYQSNQTLCTLQKVWPLLPNSVLTLLPCAHLVNYNKINNL